MKTLKPITVAALCGLSPEALLAQEVAPLTEQETALFGDSPVFHTRTITSPHNTLCHAQRIQGADGEKVLLTFTDGFDAANRTLQEQAQEVPGGYGGAHLEARETCERWRELFDHQAAL